jgi:MOSC domain-containing protein YiiM
MSQGRIEHIHIAEAEGAPVRAVDTVQAIAGVGLEGDRYAKGKGFWPDDGESRDLTLIEAEAVEAAAAAGVSLAPGESRRNVTTRGIRLNDLVGKEFWIGGVLARGTDLCEPCTHLAAMTGKPVIKPLVHRGGLRADLLTSGPIRVGDAIRVADSVPTAPRA